MSFRGPTVFALLTALFCVSSSGAPPSADSRSIIGPGEFTPVLRPAPGQSQVYVAAFRLDARPVTNAQFLEFVRTRPQWRRDRVAALFADEGYLSHWAAADALGPGILPDQPITRVSWFAARAYCAAAGGRLPEWNEWEFAAAADERVADARADPAWRARILDWYARPATDPLKAVGLAEPNLYGIQDLHGLIWEWVEDFGSLMVSGDSRTQGDPDKLEFCGAGSISAQDRENYPVLMRVAFLSALEGRSTARRLGFRCAERAQAPVQTVPPPPAGSLPGNSLYRLDMDLETAAGVSVPFAALRGKALLMTMFYGHCNSVCPMVTHQLQLLERRLDPGTRANIRVVMISLDPAADTPRELSRFSQQHRLDDSRWVIARTGPEAVRLLAAVLGVRYRQLPDGSFNHSTVIALADALGVIRSRMAGIQADDAELVSVANSMYSATAASRRDRASRRRQ